MPRWGVQAAVCAVVAAASLSACSSDSGGDSAPPNSTTTSRPPFNGKTLANGDVQKVTDLGGTRMQPVTDAEVRGPGVALKLLEFGTAEQVDDTTGQSYRAPEKSTLIAFRTSTTVDKNVENKNLSQLAFSVSVDGTQRTLSDFLTSESSSGPATASYIVAVPEERRTVGLQLKAPGLTQTIDLLEGKPGNDRPKALYRPTEGTVLKQEALQPASFNVTPTADRAPSQQTVTVKEVNFSYFNGVNSSVPSSPEKAWLTFVGASVTTPRGIFCVTPISGHKLTDDTGATYTPNEASSKMPSESFIAEESFTVSFEVPATIKGATLIVAPTQMRCQVSTGNWVNRPSSGEAKIAVTIPEK